MRGEKKQTIPSTLLLENNTPKYGKSIFKACFSRQAMCRSTSWAQASSAVLP